MKIKLKELYFFGFLTLVSSCFCLNFIFFSNSDSKLFPISSNEDDIESYDEKTLELKLVEELSQLSPSELNQLISQM
jgi:hypothetical protein